MSLLFMYNCLKKKLWIFIVSLIVTFLFGFLLSAIVKQDQYKSSVDTYYHKISYEFAKDFDLDFYYLFFAYYTDEEEFYEEVSMDYFRHTEVIKKVYDDVIDAGYTLTYEELENSIATYLRSVDMRRRTIVILQNKEVSIFVLERLLVYVPEMFNQVINARITTEIEHRIMQKDKLIKDIEEISNEIYRMKNSNVISMSLLLLEYDMSVIMQAYQQNEYYIVELTNIHDYDYYRMFEKSNYIVEEGVLISQNRVMVGIAMMILVICGWIFYCYFHYTKKMIE